MLQNANKSIVRETEFAHMVGRWVLGFCLLFRLPVHKVATLLINLTEMKLNDISYVTRVGCERALICVFQKKSLKHFVSSCQVT